MHAPTKTILLGEDDPDDQEILAEVLSDLDNRFTLMPISNGINLLEYLNTLTDDLLPSLILLDYNLPMLNGAEILKSLSEDNRYSSIPKLVWSTSGSPDCISRCIDYGAADYIIKPKDIQSLREGVQYILSYC